MRMICAHWQFIAGLHVANVDVLFCIIEVGDEVIIAKKTEGPVDYSKYNKEAGDNLLFCN